MTKLKIYSVPALLFSLFAFALICLSAMYFQVLIGLTPLLLLIMLGCKFLIWITKKLENTPHVNQIPQANTDTTSAKDNQSSQNTTRKHLRNVAVHDV